MQHMRGGRQSVAEAGHQKDARWLGAGAPVRGWPAGSPWKPAQRVERACAGRPWLPANLIPRFLFLQGMLPAVEMLRGEALLYGGGAGPHGLPSPRRIKHFPLAALPADAPARFAALFAERARWEWEDLAPYIQVRTLLACRRRAARGASPLSAAQPAH